MEEDRLIGCLPSPLHSTAWGLNDVFISALGQFVCLSVCLNAG